MTPWSPCRSSAPLLLCLFLMVGGGSSCASAPSSEAMTVTTADLAVLAESDFHRALTMGTVTGGRDTKAWHRSWVGDAEFRRALEASLVAVDWAATANAAHFGLDVELQEQESTFVGFDLDAWVTVRYVVAPIAGGDAVYDHTIRTGFRVPHGVAFSGVEKQRLAFEGAVKDNITSFLTGLGELVLGTPSQ